ncbi:hypothetical protein HYR54_14500 [Candidatus Acetothermia bacterium]|nr:hypothetical protein [Candidatus Acetothermia bacterium]
MKFFSILLATVFVSLGVVSVAAQSAPSQTWLLLVHGIWPGSGWDWQKTAYWLKQAEPNSKILVPTLDGRAGLYKWADNLTHYVQSQSLLDPPSQINILAHSFGASATLFLLRTAYELERGDLPALLEKLDCSGYWGNALFACKEMRDGWKRLLTSETERARWIAMAQKIQSVTLYHPALQGACGACADVLGLAGHTSGGLCLLERIASWLWAPLDRITWNGEKRILNLYGGMAWSFSLCGITANDVALSIQQQKMQSPEVHDSCGKGYQELDAGSYSHVSFIYRWNVARDLVERVRNWLSALPDSTQTCRSR